MRRLHFAVHEPLSTSLRDTMSFILDHLSYTYQPGTAYEVPALKDISLKIDDGEFIGLIGHTGSGKSTLVQHLNGLLKGTSGTIYYNGQDIYDKDYSLHDLRMEVGMVFQYPENQLFEETVMKDVMFGPKNQGLDEKEQTLRAYDALKKVHFPDDSFDQSPFALSGGEQRRAAIAGVLAMKPNTLILDEPTAGLDPQGRDELFGLLKELHDNSGITIIIVSHSMEDVAEYVGRILVMNDGQVVFDGTPHEVFAHGKELSALSLSVPAVTSFTEKLINKGFFRDASVSPAVTVEEAEDMILKALGRRA